MPTIILYRALKLEIDISPELPSLGICWTSDWAHAFPYGYKQVIGEYYIYSAKVSLEDIDVEKTKAVRTGQFSHEREVVLKPGNYVEVIRIEKVTIHPPIREGKDWIFHKEIKLINTNFRTKI